MFKRILLGLAILLAIAMPLRSWAADQAPVHGETAAAQHGEAGGHGEKAELLNPSSSVWQNQAFVTAVWIVVIFVILLVILYPTAWKGVLQGLEAREKRIRTDIANAEAARLKAEATLKQYNDQLAAAEARVRDLLAKATLDGEKLAANIRASAQKEAEEIKVHAQKEIEFAKNQAIGEIYDQAANLATSVAEKILRRNLNAADQKDLVARSLEQVQSMNRN